MRAKERVLLLNICLLVLFTGYCLPGCPPISVVLRAGHPACGHQSDSRGELLAEGTSLKLKYR